MEVTPTPAAGAGSRHRGASPKPLDGGCSLERRQENRTQDRALYGQDCPSTAPAPRHSQILPPGLTHRTRRLNSQGRWGDGGEELNPPGWRSRQRQRTGPNTCTFFQAHVSSPRRRWGGEGKGGSQLQPLLSRSSAYHPSHTWKSQGKVSKQQHRRQSGGGNRVGCANPRSAPASPPAPGLQGSVLCPGEGMTNKSWAKGLDFELPLTEAKVIKAPGGGCP